MQCDQLEVGATLPDFMMGTALHFVLKAEGHLVRRFDDRLSIIPYWLYASVGSVIGPWARIRKE